LREVLKKHMAKKSRSTFKLLGCSIADFMRHLETRFQEGMTWENYGEWQIDHVKPCASFDLTDPKQQEICFHFSNLQPLWERDNKSKSDRDYYEWIELQNTIGDTVGTEPSSANSD